jgi:hypothetical protein
MRQIDDKWRGDMYESNYYQVLKNLFNTYQFTDEDNANIQHYTNELIRKTFMKKCSNACLDTKTLNFNNCVESCLVKYTNTLSHFSQAEHDFESKYNTYNASGKYFFST